MNYCTREVFNNAKKKKKKYEKALTNSGYPLALIFASEGDNCDYRGTTTTTATTNNNQEISS